jgi:putative acetyltransferase
MLVRTYRNGDIPAISRLYYDTIHRVNVQDYSREQVDAWAPEVPDESFWKERFKQYTVYVADQKGTVIGFTELGSTGHIDCFFVHHEWQRRGVGTRLMKRVMTTATKKSIPRLDAEVSITAAPFFLSKGFVVVKENETVRHSVTLKQFAMEKWLLS